MSLTEVTLLAALAWGLGTLILLFIAYRWFSSVTKPPSEAPPPGVWPKYPLVLVHGLLGFDTVKVLGKKITYFNRIVHSLEQSGITVYCPKLPASASIEVRATALAEFIKKLELSGNRVNIVGHSMGGLDARFAISNLGISHLVESLTTIGTPHYGSALADISVTAAEKVNVTKMVKKLGVDVDAFFDLTTTSMGQFNESVVNSEGTSYYSVTGHGKPGRKGMMPALVPGYLAFRSQRILENDGVVATASQKWGTVLFEVEADHLAQIGWSKNFDAIDLYLRIAKSLAESGH